MGQNMEKHGKMWQNVTKCDKMCQNVTKCDKIGQNGTKLELMRGKRDHRKKEKLRQRKGKNKRGTSYMNIGDYNKYMLDKSSS